MQEELISIIVPVYNAAPYLEECLESIAAQTYTGFECILVDDGSTDSSGAICDDFCRKDSRFRVIHQENSGVGFARNRGLDQARGTYIQFIDSDDVVLPGMLQAAATLIQSGAYDWVSWNAEPGSMRKENRLTQFPGMPPAVISRNMIPSNGCSFLQAPRIIRKRIPVQFGINCTAGHWWAVCVLYTPVTTKISALILSCFKRHGGPHICAKHFTYGANTPVPQRIPILQSRCLRV